MYLAPKAFTRKKYGDPCFTHMHDVDLTTNLYENSLSAENYDPFLIDYADVLKLTFITESFARTQLLTGLPQTLKVKSASSCFMSDNISVVLFFLKVSRGLVTN